MSTTHILILGAIAGATIFLGLPVGRIRGLNAQTRGIVAFRMTLTKVEAKTKLSQNRDMEDRTRVIAKLEASEGDDAKATAAWMKKVLP